MDDESNIDIIALGIAGLKMASAGAKVLNAVGGTKGLASVGLYHCSHCKGRRGPCQCGFGCPTPTNALRKTQCFPIHTGTSCDSCGSQNFPGSRFKCQTCSDFDLCQSCYEGGRHDNTHPFFHIAALGRLPELLQPRCNPPAAPPIPTPSYKHQHHSSISSSTSTITSSSSSSFMRPRHTGISCDSCGDQNMQGNRFKCQTCDEFDLCQSCFDDNIHDGSHAFALIVKEGATPIFLAKPQNAVSQAATSSPLQANPPRQPQYYPSDVRHQTFTTVSATSPFAPNIKGMLSESDGSDSTPYLMESSTSLSSSQPHLRLYQHTTDASSFLDTSSTSLKAPRPLDLVPYEPRGWQSSENMNAMPKPLAAQNDIGNTAATSLPPRQNAGEPIHVLHCHVFCKGPRCRGATQCIVGPRYTCAKCPRSVDLCETCYSSQAAHNISHSFKRFDRADSSTYITCPPQQQQQQHQQQQQGRQTGHEQHPNVFCNGPRCRGATQCIVGPSGPQYFSLFQAIRQGWSYDVRIVFAADTDAAIAAAADSTRTASKCVLRWAKVSRGDTVHRWASVYVRQLPTFC
ncbi:NBR1-like protein [Fragilaria crotonensis]|nr:NBR1-like protein [Fragilaria crotonensis]